MGLERQQTTKLALDVHSSLILIKVVGEAIQALPLVARRIRNQVSSSHSVLLSEDICALLLPATPFSGAQVLASRLVQLLVNVPHEIHVYHGTTALLVLQRLRKSGVVAITDETTAESATPVIPVKSDQSIQKERKETAVVSLPYLAFLTHYPATPLLHLFPYELACHYQCAPIGAARNMLTLATCRWLNREIIAQLRAATRRGIFQVRCDVTMIDEILGYWQRLQEAPNSNAGLKK